MVKINLKTANRNIQGPRKAKKKNALKKKDFQEVTAIGKALRAIGGIGGTYLGGMLGQSAAGSAVGTGLGAAISRWFGQGDYVVTKNSILTSSNDIPMMHKTNQCVTVRHREFLCDVVGSTAYTIQQKFPINPGMSQTFPWLCALAQNFQEYTLTGMVFHYVPTSGDAIASTNNALGSVMLVTNYRSTAAAPGTKSQLLNEYFSSDSKPSDAFAHPIECDPKENPYNVQYVRTGVVPAGEDPKTYDLGTTFLATTGMQAAVTVGELWVTYEVELRKPKASAASTFNQSFENIDMSITDNTSAAVACNGSPHNTLGCVFSTYGNNQLAITVPAGVVGPFRVLVTGTSTSQSSLLTPSVNNGTLVNDAELLNNNSSGVYIGCFAFTPTDMSLPVTAYFKTTTWVTSNYFTVVVVPISSV